MKSSLDLLKSFTLILFLSFRNITVLELSLKMEPELDGANIIEKDILGKVELIIG